jgi:hypothetical protein
VEFDIEFTGEKLRVFGEVKRDRIAGLVHPDIIG